jgi:flavin-dependent dehydrogenase
VAIVGASTSGLLTAIRLAEAGKRVRLYERSRSAAAARRTLIVTDELMELAGDVAAGAVTNQIDAFEIIAGSRRLEVPLTKPDLVIERATLIADLAARAEAAGVELSWGSSFAGLEIRGDDVMMVLGERGHLTKQRVTTLVGADGMSSRVASTLAWPRPSRLSLIQAIVRVPRGTPENVSRVWFEPDSTPYFFWLVPESATRAAVGLISEDGRTARRVLDSFLVREHFEPVTYQAARIPGYDRWIPPHRKIGRSDVYLVGDAAGHVKVTTVGGIVNGFRGAEAVVGAITGGTRRRPFRGLRRELDTHLLIRRVLHGMGTREYETLLTLFNDSLTRRAGATTRDRPARLLVQSLLAQPRLVTFGAATVLRSMLRGPAAAPNQPPSERPVSLPGGRSSWGLLTGRAAKEELESAR